MLLLSFRCQIFQIYFNLYPLKIKLFFNFTENNKIINFLAIYLLSLEKKHIFLSNIKIKMFFYQIAFLKYQSKRFFNFFLWNKSKTAELFELLESHASHQMKFQFFKLKVKKFL